VKKTVLFDLDGTLLNTLGDLAAAVNSALSGLSFPQRSVDEIRSFIGNGVPALIRRALPEGTDNGVWKRAVDAFTEYYLAHICDNTLPYDGIPELLGFLRTNGVNVGIVSNKKDAATRLVCEKLLDGLFDYAAGARNEAERKPKPDMVFAAMKYFSASFQDTLYVGDSDVDILTAKNAGIDCVSVLWGYRDEAHLRAAGGKIFVSTAYSLRESILTL